MSEEKTWTELEMQFALFSWLEQRGRTLILANFTPHKWHECDIFSLTKALYFHEIEVKISRADFLADFNKRVKHDALNGGEVYGQRYQRGMPRTFCYACPENLLSIIDMPEYAGLISVVREKKGWENHWNGYHIEVIKKPPRLLAQKMSAEQVFKISNNLWWRYAKTWKDKAKIIITKSDGSGLDK